MLPNIRDRAHQAVATENARRFLAKTYGDGFPKIEDPIQAMLDLAAEAWAGKEYFRDMIDSLRYEHQSGEQLRAEVALYERALERCQKIFESIVRLGIAERQTRIRESEAVMFLKVLQRISDKLDLDPAQRTIWAEVVPREMRAISNGNA